MPVLAPSATPPTDDNSLPKTQVVDAFAPGQSPPAGILSRLAESDEWLASLRQLREQEPDAAARLESAAAEMPSAGDTFGRLRLVSELGSGAFGRVFLATQPDLADRFVAVKITANFTGEPQKLAQLQHTNIVPVYSVHYADPLQAVVMPYMGSTTLAHVIDHLRCSDGKLPSSGTYVLSTLKNHRTTVASASKESGQVASGEKDLGQSIGLASVPNPHVVLNMFRDMSYVNATLWIAARIAGGLAHAHERGILHRDLKPANILLTDEGQPMLLDFNLAEDLKESFASGRARMGGTLPYMAPEQLRCVLGNRQPVDERSDLYAVGIVLFELLTGRFPFDRPRSTNKNYVEEMLANRLKSPPGLRKLNPNVTPAVEAIVRKLLDPEPSRRYSRAIYLEEDLDRQLADKPLRFASEPSPRERLSKWRRRNPKLATGLLVALAATLFLILPATAIAVRLKQSAESRRLIETHEARDGLAQTEIDFRDVQATLTTRLGDRKLIETGLTKSRAILDRYQIGRNDAWREARGFARLSEDEQRRLVEMVGQALLLSARGEALLAEDAKSRRPDDAANHLKTALNLNDAAKNVFGDRSPRSLWRQRSDFLSAAGNKADAKEIERAIRRAAPQSDFDQYVEAADLAASGKYQEALAKIEPMVLRNPTDFAAWFVQGLCHNALDHFADAAECYSVCIALQPNSHMAYLNRGIMRLRQGDRRRAEMDFSHCIELKPKNVDAWINRALARMELKKLSEAERDLTEAMKLSEAPTRVYFIRSLVRDRLGAKEGAARDREEGMRRTPEDSLSWITRGFQRQASDPKAALRDYDSALDLNPRSRDALINKANVLSEDLKQPEKALKVFERMIELWPDDLDARGSRGVVLARLGKVDQARKDAEFCLEHSNTPFVCFQMAGLYAQVSRHSKSAEDRRWALHLLAMSLRKGFDRLDLVAGDPDLEPIRNEAEYRRLAELAQNLARESSR